MKKLEMKIGSRKPVAMMVALALILTISLGGISFAYGYEFCNDGECGNCIDYGFLNSGLPAGQTGDANGAEGEEITIADEDTPRTGPRVGSAAELSDGRFASLSDKLLYTLTVSSLFSLLGFIITFMFKKREGEEEAARNDYEF